MDLRAVAIYGFDDDVRTMRLCCWKTERRVEAKGKDYYGLQTAVAEMKRFLVR